ncbi:MAG: hypothetical protein KDN20_14775 [Verrucomicrobiae bacterium]|nr:hypothetical protein [Verrucomicrobiae bacterium]
MIIRRLSADPEPDLKSIDDLPALPLAPGFKQEGRRQLITLLQAGLSPDSLLLDIGCGWLRGGYWFIHFLNAGGYHGIEPWEARLEFGRHSILPPEILAGKQPRFSGNEDYDFTEFGRETFDFFFASSIWSHCSKQAIDRMLSQAARHSHQESLFITSCWRATATHPDHAEDRWLGKNKDDGQGVTKVHHDFDKLRKMAAGHGFGMQDLYPNRSYSWLKFSRL